MPQGKQITADLFLPAQNKLKVSKMRSKVHQNCWFQQMNVLTSVAWTAASETC